MAIMTLEQIVNDTDLAPSQKNRLLQIIKERSINSLVDEVHLNAKNHGFWDKDREFGTLLMLIVREVSESLEEYRNNKPAIYHIDGKPEGIAIELIDAVLRIMDLFGREGWDFQRALEIKHAYNLTRPHMHGGKKI